MLLGPHDLLVIIVRKSTIVVDQSALGVVAGSLMLTVKRDATRLNRIELLLQG